MYYDKDYLERYLKNSLKKKKKGKKKSLITAVKERKKKKNSTKIRRVQQAYCMRIVAGEWEKKMAETKMRGGGTRGGRKARKRDE